MLSSLNTTKRIWAELICSALIICTLSCTKATSRNDLPESAPAALVENHVRVNDIIGGFYSAIPANYHETERYYPLLLFIHGAGQYGDGKEDLKLLLHDAIPVLLDKKVFPPNFNVNGQNFSFVIAAPQFSRMPTSQNLLSFLDYILQNYRIDVSRIYIAGMSEGAEVTCDMAAEFSSKIAAIVPMAGASMHGDMNAKCKNLAESNLPIWLFHNRNDEVIDISYSETFINTINRFYPALRPRFTILKPFGLFGHDAWTKATDPGYKEEGRNIYEWMLQYNK